MTSSAGASGLILAASPPSSTIASRIVARSTTHGTPVKSCMTTRAGVNWISVSGSALGSQPASARMWSAVMLAPSSVRSRFSSRIFSEYGSRSAALHRVEPVDLVGSTRRPRGCSCCQSCPASRSPLRTPLVATILPLGLAQPRARPGKVSRHQDTSQPPTAGESTTFSRSADAFARHAGMANRPPSMLNVVDSRGRWQGGRLASGGGPAGCLEGQGGQQGDAHQQAG